MECEICGNKIRGKLFRVLMNEQELFVCNDCSKFGNKVIEQEKTKPNFSKPLQNLNAEKQVVFDEGLDLIENYGLLLRKAREKKGFTIAELAKKIFEKESILHKVENQKMLPSDSLIAKLEKNLSIKLRSK